MHKPSPTHIRANYFIRMGKPAEAHELLSRALRGKPNDASLHALMGVVETCLDRFDQSEAHLRRAVALAPQEPEHRQSLAELLLSLGRTSEGEREFEAAARQAVSLGRGGVGWHTFVMSLYQRKRYARAAEIAQMGLAECGWFPPLARMRGSALLQYGRCQEAMEFWREAAAALPQDHLIAALYAFSLNYPAEIDPLETSRAHVRAGELLSAHVGTPLEHVSPGPGAADKRLRLAFVSGDLRQHACSYFAEPLLASLDRTEFETFCYYVEATEDQRSATLKRLVSVWRSCADETPRQLAKRIRGDQIDVLVDLSGHTHNNRLAAFALRPAPVQMTYLGYPNTTGVATIGYRIVDSITDPPGAEKYVTERLVRIDPCFLCFTSMEDAAVAPLPPSQVEGGKGAGRITFGSFNALQKVNDRLIGLWAAVLAATPGSRMLMKYQGLGDPGAQAAITERFARAGVGAERLILLPATNGYREHLETYAHIDIALDTHPYHGTTTTCEAMWMGVPVVTLGDSPDVHAARVGNSLLSAVGLADLVAQDRAGYVRLATELAADAPRLAELRASLRDRMKSSTLCDRAAFGKRFGAAVRSAWREWCGA